MIIIVNLNLMVTRNCNLKCAHCLRGESANEDISQEALEKIFKKGTVIQLLELNGGEVFSKPDVLKRVIDTIIKNRVIVSHVNIPTNGTLYLPRIEKELTRLNEYIIYCNLLSGKIPELKNVEVNISQDPYHAAELKELEKSNPELLNFYLLNIRHLIESKFYFGPRKYYKLIKSGRAKNLEEATTEPTCYPIYYFETRLPIGQLTQVNIVGVDINGTVCNTCGEMPPTGKNVYGSLLTEDLETIIKRVGKRCESDDEFYERYMAEIRETMKEAQKVKK